MTAVERVWSGGNAEDIGETCACWLADVSPPKRASSRDNVAELK